MEKRLINIYFPNNLGGNMDWCKENYAFSVYIDKDIDLLDYIISIRSDYYSVAALDGNNVLLFSISGLLHIDDYGSSKSKLTLDDLKDINELLENGVLKFVQAQSGNYLKKLPKKK